MYIYINRKRTHAHEMTNSPITKKLTVSCMNFANSVDDATLSTFWLVVFQYRRLTLIKIHVITSESITVVLTYMVTTNGITTSHTDRSGLDFVPEDLPERRRLERLDDTRRELRLALPLLLPSPLLLLLLLTLARLLLRLVDLRLLLLLLWLVLLRLELLRLLLSRFSRTTSVDIVRGVRIGRCQCLVGNRVVVCSHFVCFVLVRSLSD
jgi:hypothetical protein